MQYTAAHWGIYEVEKGGEHGIRLKAFGRDPDPSPIGLGAVEVINGPTRVRRPAVRLSWLEAQRARLRERRGGTRPSSALGADEVSAGLRGTEAFVEVDWNEALDLVAAALGDVIALHGNGAIYGGSYGWSSAGRFHHAQSQVHRFLNAIGGYVRHTESYSLAACDVLLRHVIAPIESMMFDHTSWDVLARHCELFVAFGGVPHKSSQISGGGAGEHQLRRSLSNMRNAGVRFVNIGPDAGDLDTGGPHEWIPVRPHSDTALMLGIAHVLYTERLHDEDFLARYCTGFEKILPYLLGATDGIAKDPAWAQAKTGVSAQRIVDLAREMARSRTMLNLMWSLQRSHHGEQPYWMAMTLAAMLGQIGTPGGGLGIGYGAANNIGGSTRRFPGPTLPQGKNEVDAFIPVARFADMLEHPGATFTYDGKTHRYPAIELVYWAGGNPFHHHQDLNRLLRAWRKPGTTIVNEQFWTATARMADVVLPATTSLERDDIGYTPRERYLVAMKRAIDPVDGARDDYEIFSGLAERLGAADRFTEGRTAREWLEHLYGRSRAAAADVDVTLPEFDTFWRQGIVDLAPRADPVVMFEDFRADPDAFPLRTPSGLIELYSETIAGYDCADCKGHAQWLEPLEWLGSTKAAKYPLHLLSDQPSTKLHSQFDQGEYSARDKIHGRAPVRMNPRDALDRGLKDGDVVRVFNDRGECLAGVRLSGQLAPGVVKLSCGAWFDPASWSGSGSLEKHGNPNVLTPDIPASGLSQGCAAQTCLVEIERYPFPAPAVTAFERPVVVPGQGGEPRRLG